MEEDWAPPFNRSSPDLKHSQGFDSDGFISPYQSTPSEKLFAILKFAELNCNDVLYDLGCGDGRVIREAVKIVQCRGVGIDLDETLIAQAKSLSAGVCDIDLIVADLLDPSLDLSQATVIFVYLIPDGLIKLKPKLEQLLTSPASKLRKVISFFWRIPGWTHSRIDASLSVYEYEPETFNNTSCK